MAPQAQTLQACESLLVEHREVETFLDQLDVLLSKNPESPGWTTETGTVLGKIDAHMNTHFACEEQGLFPILERYHPMVLMEVEHEELIALRDALLTAFNEKQWAVIKQKGTTLSKELRDHIGREEAGIFPAAERSLSEDEKQVVIAKMDAVREAAKTQPTGIQRPERLCIPFESKITDTAGKPKSIKKLVERGPITVKELTLKSGEALAEHWTPCALVLLCVAGEARFESGDITSPLSAGHGVYIDPQRRHAVFAEVDSRFLLILCDLHHA